QNATYFLSPNWNHHPGGRIAIGNIIVNPLKPHIALTKAGTGTALATDTSREKNWILSVETATNLSASLWAVVLEKINFGFSANRERIKRNKFTMSALETTTLSDHPTTEDIKKRCNDPAVKEFMRLDSMLCKLVCMVTGIKVAKDFKLEGEKSLSKGFAAEASGEVAPEVSVGGSVGVQRTNRIADEFESEGDIIFAYEVLKIKRKGWSKEKTFKIEEYKTRQAFLGDETKDDEDVDGEVE
ncbi:hypothetical protein CC86DRAFT_241830, partial [Ophiobolus disseminans]